MKTSREFEREFLEHIFTETGKNISDWMAIIDILPEGDRENIIFWLQSEYGITFRQAALLANYFLNGKKPTYG